MKYRSIDTTPVAAAKVGSRGARVRREFDSPDRLLIRLTLGKGGGDEGRDDTPARLAGMGEGDAHDMHPAALPGAGQHLGDGGLDALTRTGALVRSLPGRKLTRLVTVAMADKTARTAWTMRTCGEDYRATAMV